MRPLDGLRPLRAVCVHPDDERYAYLKGKKVIVPLVNRIVPVIFDEYVDKEFGTGALKITPAHDINDYNLGLKHNLETIDTLNPDGTMSEAAQVFVGLDRFEARKKAIEKLKADGLLIKEEEYTTRLGFSQRTNAVVEPRISTQWFVKMQSLAKPALDAVIRIGNVDDSGNARLSGPAPPRRAGGRRWPTRRGRGGPPTAPMSSSLRCETAHWPRIGSL
jgi:valyl-tRNA synthetase